MDANLDNELLQSAVIDVYSVSGVKVMQVPVQGRLTPVTASKLAAGTYFFQFKAKDGFSKIMKVILK